MAVPDRSCLGFVEDLHGCFVDEKTPREEPGRRSIGSSSGTEPDETSPPGSSGGRIQGWEVGGDPRSSSNLMCTSCPGALFGDL